MIETANQNSILGTRHHDRRRSSESSFMDIHFYCKFKFNIMFKSKLLVFKPQMKKSWLLLYI